MKSVKPKKSAEKSNWAEDDLSDAANNEVLPQKKQKKVKKAAKLPEKAVKSSKVPKTKKKGAKPQSSVSSDEEDYGASLDKLKEIDPEFYKVTNTVLPVAYDLNIILVLFLNSFWSKMKRNC